MEQPPAGTTPTGPSTASDLPAPEPPSLVKAGLGGLLAVAVLIGIGVLLWYVWAKPDYSTPAEQGELEGGQPAVPVAAVAAPSAALTVSSGGGSKTLAVRLASQQAAADYRFYQPFGCKYVSGSPKCVRTPLQASHSARLFKVADDWTGVSGGSLVTIRFLDLDTRVYYQFACRNPDSAYHVCGKVYYGPFDKAYWQVVVYWGRTFIQFGRRPLILFF